MCHASAFRSRDRHQSHVCVFAWPGLNVGELTRFYNQPQHLATLSLHLVDLACDELLEFADIGRELANTFRGFLRRHCISVHEVAELLLVQLEPFHVCAFYAPDFPQA
jgi:hypothetical protein